MDADGKNKIKLPNTKDSSSVVWSPDGSKIVTCYGGPEYGYNLGVTEVPLTIDGPQPFKEPHTSTPRERVPGFQAVLAMVELLTLAYVIRKGR